MTATTVQCAGATSIWTQDEVPCRSCERGWTTVDDSGRLA